MQSAINPTKLIKNQSLMLHKNLNRVWLILYALVNIIICITSIYLLSGKGINTTQFLIIFCAQLSIAIIICMVWIVSRIASSVITNKIRSIQSAHISSGITMICCCVAICVGSQILQWENLRKKSSEINSLEKRLSDAYSTIRSSRAQNSFNLSKVGAYAFKEQLKAVDHALNVDANRTYYNEAIKPLYTYLDYISYIEFSGSIDKFNRYRNDINFMFDGIGKKKYNYRIKTQLSEIKSKFDEKMRDIDDTLKSMYHRSL